MKVGIIGGGQLARMLALAGIPLGIDFVFLIDKDENCVESLGSIIKASKDLLCSYQELAQRCDVITFESENIFDDAMEALGQLTNLSPSALSLATCQDRHNESQLFTKLKIPIPKTAPLSHYSNVDALLEDFPTPFIIKRTVGGFDGRSQTIIDSPEALSSIEFTHDKAYCIVQSMVKFEAEVSCITVHDSNNNTVAYPLCVNHHKKGILRYTLPDTAHPLTTEAIGYNTKIAKELNYCGVLVVEYFVVEGKLIANETAPRVHNSGHWTIDAAYTSQFENHLRAILGWPLGDTRLMLPAMLVNIISDWPDKKLLLSNPGLALHDYQKSPAENRKIGHVTVVGKENVDSFLQKNGSLLI